MDECDLNGGAFMTEKWGDEELTTKYPRRDVINSLLIDGWLPSIDDMKKAFIDSDVFDKDSFMEFVVGVAWLRYEATKSGLTEEEVNELKSNIGIVSIDMLREGIKEKHLETYGA